MPAITAMVIKTASRVLIRQIDLRCLGPEHAQHCLWREKRRDKPTDKQHDNTVLVLH